MILGKTFLSKSIVPQEPSDIWDERCTSLHWDPGGRPYEGWIQCLPMGLLGSLWDAPCVDTTQGSSGCNLTSAILIFIWDPRITVTGSLVISIGCFQEVSGDGTMQCIANEILYKNREDSNPTSFIKCQYISPSNVGI